MNPDDLKIETVSHVRPGGQHVGLPLPEIKVTHIPSGNYVVIRSERSQTKCRDLAMSMLEWMETEMRG